MLERKKQKLFQRRTSERKMSASCQDFFLMSFVIPLVQRNYNAVAVFVEKDFKKEI